MSEIDSIQTLHEMKTRSDFLFARQAYKEISCFIDKWEKCGVDMECHWDGTIRVNDNWFHRLDFENSEIEVCVVSREFKNTDNNTRAEWTKAFGEQ